jgi:uncharacterized iron-regulated protein
MKRIFGTVTLILLVATAIAQNNKPAYLIYDKTGKEISYTKMMKEVQSADVLFFGEQHNNPICHWLQLQVTKDLHAKKGDKLVLGAEMFEADNQLIINEYLAGNIIAKSFKSECRLWNNYDTDYEPLMEFAKENNLPFIATNIPRRYANVVYKQGFEGLESLSKEAKSYISPLPIKYDPELACYKSIVEMSGGHGGDKLPKAQAIKDATMAHFMLQNWSKGKLFLHYNGAYHSDNFESIVWYIKQAQPEINSITITSVTQEKIKSLEKEHKNKADYIICIPEDMTTTY